MHICSINSTQTNVRMLRTDEAFGGKRLNRQHIAKRTVQSYILVMTQLLNNKLIEYNYKLQQSSTSTSLTRRKILWL